LLDFLTLNFKSKTWVTFFCKQDACITLQARRLSYILGRLQSTKNVG